MTAGGGALGEGEVETIESVLMYCFELRRSTLVEVATTGESEVYELKNGRRRKSRSSLIAACFSPTCHQLLKLAVNAEGISGAGGREEDESIATRRRRRARIKRY